MTEHYEYKNAKEYQQYLRGGGRIHDLLIVGGVLYTMDEYDMPGRFITYGNRKHSRMMTIETADRYGAAGFTDALITTDELTAWRNDIVYAQ